MKMATAIPGISALYAILKRHIDRGNDVLSQRKDLANELRENCLKWTALLEETFLQVEQKVDDFDFRGAQKTIEAQMADFMKVDYKFLEQESPILLFLAEDNQFKGFVESCAGFYRSGLDVKRIVYASIPDANGNEIRLKTDGLSKVSQAWRNELERMLGRVNHEYMKVKTIVPK